MTVNETRSLASIRKSLNISQEKLARRTNDVSIGTIRNAELYRHRITVGKAQQILAAINSLLTEKQQPALTLDDLQLKLY